MILAALIVAGLALVAVVATVVISVRSSYDYEPTRELVDSDGDHWFEVEKNGFVWAFDREDAELRAARVPGPQRRFQTYEEVVKYNGPVDEVDAQ